MSELQITLLSGGIGLFGVLVGIMMPRAHQKQDKESSDSVRLALVEDRIIGIKEELALIKGQLLAVWRKLDKPCGESNDG